VTITELRELLAEASGDSSATWTLSEVADGVAITVSIGENLATRFVHGIHLEAYGKIVVGDIMRDLESRCRR
jgi:hypothetical protein